MKPIIVELQARRHTRSVQLKPIGKLMWPLRLLELKGFRLIQTLLKQLQFPSNLPECHSKLLELQHLLLKMSQWTFAKLLLLARRWLAKWRGYSKKLLRSSKIGLLKYKKQKSLFRSFGLSCNRFSLDWPKNLQQFKPRAKQNSNYCWLRYLMGLRCLLQ